VRHHRKWVPEFSHTAKKEESSPRKLPSTGWHSIVERHEGGVLVGNNHVIWLKGELFIGNMDRATDPFLFTSALLLRHSRHFGHSIEQFHLMAATHEPKMPVAVLKEGGKSVTPTKNVGAPILCMVVAILFLSLF
jgi:hypothetical protein